MKLVLALPICVPLLADAQDFREHSWGDSRDSVIAKEGEPVINEEEAIVYETTLGGFDVLLALTFLDDRLEGAVYRFTEPHSSENSYIEDFRRFEELLQERYGQPTSEVVNWYDDLYRDDPDRHGFAISIGHLVFQTSWETERVIVRHNLTGDNYEISHAIAYRSTVLAEEADARRQQDTLDQL